MVMPRSRSSGALSIWSKATNVAVPLAARIFVMAAVSVVLPWSTWPIVPTFTCGLLRSNFSFAMLLFSVPRSSLSVHEERTTENFFLSCNLGNHFVGHALRRRLVCRELHRVAGATLRHRSQLRGVPKHF